MTNAIPTHKCLECKKPCQVTTVKRRHSSTVRSTCCLSTNLVELVK